MKTRLRTFRVRLTLWYVLVLAVILGLFSIALYATLDRTLDNRVDDELRSAARQVRAAISVAEGQPIISDAEQDNEISPLSDAGFLVRVFSSDGQTVASSGPFHTLPHDSATMPPAQPGQELFALANVPADGTPLRLYTVPVVEGGRVYGFVQVGESIKPIQDTLHTLALVLAIVMPITLALASAGGYFLASRALAPIERITNAARDIGATNLALRLNLPLPDDELGRLARTFDAMLDRLEDAFRRQRDFTADASHELRTPLAIIKGDIGVALNRRRSPDEYIAMLASVEEEVDRLTRLVNDLLLLARADSGQPLTHTEPLAVAGLLEVVTEQLRPLAEAKSQTLQLHVAAELLVEGDADKLLRLFLNLLDNAVKYTPQGGRISVSASGAAGHDVVIEVADNGPGIPPGQLEQIFERFQRADAARTRAQGGWGLGLAIARSIATAHGGLIAAHGNPGGGTVVRVRLPAAPCAAKKGGEPADGKSS